MGAEADGARICIVFGGTFVSLTARAGLSSCFSSIRFFREGAIIVAKDAAQVWLMSNHPEGMRRMMQED